VLGGADLPASFAAEMEARAGGEVPGVCPSDREYFGDLPVGVVERFAEHVGGSFDGRHALEEHEHRAVERFGALRAVRDVDRLGSHVPMWVSHRALADWVTLIATRVAAASENATASRTLLRSVPC
jgi:hypothetical protein